MKPVKSKKYDFDIDVSSNTYVGELALPYVTAAVLGAETINKDRCRLMEGIVGKAVINGLSFTDVIQAADCSGTDGNDLTLTTQTLTLNDLMVKEEICRKTIFPTFVAAQGRMSRAGNIPPTFAEFLMSALAAQTGTSLENLLWQGSAAFPFGFLSNDGTIDEAGIDASAMADFIEADLDTGGAPGAEAGPFTATNILFYLSSVFNAAQAVPGILQKPGCGFYISYEAYAFFLQAMATQNTGPGYNQSMEGATYLGYPVYPTPGIPNAVDVIAFTYPENLVVGTNAYSGNEQAALIPVYQYDGSDNVKASLDFSVGVQVGVPGDGVVGFAFT
jgi:hypothetical protein